MRETMLLIQSVAPDETNKQPCPQKRGCFLYGGGCPSGTGTLKAGPDPACACLTFSMEAGTVTKSAARHGGVVLYSSVLLSVQAR